MASLTPEEEAQIAAYFGTGPMAPSPDPFGQGAAAAGISPPPSAPAPAAPAAPLDPFAAGASKAGIAPPAERVYNDFDPSQVKGVQLAEKPAPTTDQKAANYFGGAKPAPPAKPQQPPGTLTLKEQTVQGTPTPRVPAGPSKPANPDPYGIKAAGDKAVGSYDAQAGAMRDTAGGEAYKAEQLGIHGTEMARRKADDADLMLREQAIAAKRLDDNIAAVNRQIEDVRSKKVRPIDVMDKGPAMGLMSVIGGILGGLYQWSIGAKENPYIVALDKQIDRQVAIDEGNLDREAKGLESKANLLQQQRALLNDNGAAKLAYKNLAYEAFKDQLASEAQQYDSPLYKSRAEAAIAELSRGQAMLQKQLGEQLRSQAMAGAASALARQREVFAAYRETYDKALAAGYSPSQAEYEAKRMVGVLYAPGTMGDRPPGGEEDGLGKAGREEIAKERKKAQLDVDANLQAIRAARGDIGKIIAGGSLGNVWKHAPAWAPGAGEARTNANAREAYNMRVRLAIGAGYRLSTGGMEPKNVEMIHELEEPFRVLPSDDEAQARQKAEALERYLIQSGNAKGATGTSTGEKRSAADAALGAKPIR